MRILYLTKLKKNNESNMAQWQIVHIVDELETNGWEVDLYYPYDESSVEERNRTIVKHAILTRPDFVLSTFNEKEVLPETLVELRSIGVPSVLICFDNLVIPFEHVSIAKYYDLVWLTSKETEYLFKKNGANTVFLPYAANPHIKVVFKPEETINRVVFVGTPYGARKILLHKIVDQGLPIDIFGRVEKKDNSQIPIIEEKATKIKNLISYSIGRKLLKATLKYRLFTPDNPLPDDDVRYMNPVPVEMVPSVYSRYALSLSSTSARNTEVLKRNVPIVNLRSFEIPMFFGVQLCRYNEELSSYFEEDKEIVFYRNNEELADKVRYYTDKSQAKQIEKIKLCARRRAESDHTWMNRFNIVCTTLGLKSK